MTSSPSDLTSLVERFLAQYTKGTVDIYRIHLRQWFEFCAARGLEPLSAGEKAINEWIAGLQSDGLRDNSVATKVTCVRGFYRTAYEVGAISSDPAAHVRRPHVDYSVKTDSLEFEEFVRLLEAAETEGDTSHALVCLLGLCGLRSGECIALDVEDVHVDADGQGHVRVASRKSSHGADIAVGRRTATACQRAMGERQGGPLLLGHDGGRLHAAAIRRTLRRLSKQASVSDDRVTTQSLRMTYYEAAKRAGIPEKDIAASMGFRSRAMLEYYDN